MIVLGIETSCDDTSAAVYDGNKLLSNVVSTQLVHRNFGGIVPELASRAHIQLISSVVTQALEHAHLEPKQIDGLAVTYGPGLAGSLLVGLSMAKGLALSLNKPLVGVNHLEGHLFANRLEHPDLSPPFLVLIVSGGHTQLVHVKDWGDYTILGRTRDDAAGEAFDKVSKLLGLGFPGGPLIEKTAKTGNPKAIRFPKANIKDHPLDFSFSGLKTAVLNHVQSLDPKTLSEAIPDIAASFQEAVVSVLIRNLIRASEETGLKKAGLSGGVAINSILRARLQDSANKHGLQVFWPSPVFCSDNGAMIACAGHYYLSSGQTSSLGISPKPSLNFDS